MKSNPRTATETWVGPYCVRPQGHLGCMIDGSAPPAGYVGRVAQAVADACAAEEAWDIDDLECWVRDQRREVSTCTIN